MAVRVRVTVPERDELVAYGAAALGHVLLVVLFLVLGRGPAHAPGPALPSMRVALTAGPPGRPAGGAAARPRPAAPKPTAPREDAPAPAPPKPQPSASRPAAAKPHPSGAVARPDDLPRQEPEPEEAPAAGHADPDADAGDAAGPAAGVPGLPGAAAGGIQGVDIDAPVRADWYVTLIVNRLQDAWSDRPVLPAGAETRQVTISFVIQRDGRVTDATVDTPSGYTPLDLSALRAVTTIQRLPPLPPAYGKDQVRCRFMFELLPPA